MLVKLTLQAGPDAQALALAVSAVSLLAGGIITEEAGLHHYTQQPEIAKREWVFRGYDVVECRELEMKEGGFD